MTTRHHLSGAGVSANMNKQQPQLYLFTSYDSPHGKEFPKIPDGREGMSEGLSGGVDGSQMDV